LLLSKENLTHTHNTKESFLLNLMRLHPLLIKVKAPNKLNIDQLSMPNVMVSAYFMLKVRFQFLVD
jgi:hypothetical protein